MNSKNLLDALSSIDEKHTDEASSPAARELAGGARKSYKIKTAAIILSVAVFAGLITAGLSLLLPEFISFGGKTPSGPEAGEVTEAYINTDETQTGEETPEQTEKIRFPYEGETFELLAPAYGGYCVALTGGETEGDTLSRDAVARWKAVCEELGVTVRVSCCDSLPGKDSADGRHKLLDAVTGALESGTGIPDIVIYPGYIDLLYTAGAFLDLNTIDTLDTGAACWPSGINSSISVNGRLFGCSGDIVSDFYAYTYALFYNRALCAEKGVDVVSLESDALSGSFTLDRFMEAISAVKDQRYSAEGVFGSGLPSMTASAASNLALAYLTGAGVEFIVNEGGELKWVYDWNDAYQVANKLKSSDEGTLTAFERPLGNNINDFTKAFDSGRLCLIPGRLGTATSGAFSSLSGGYGVLPFPKYDGNQESYRTLTARNGVMMYAIPAANTEKAEAAGALIGALARDAYDNLRHTFIESVLPDATDNGRRIMNLLFDTAECPRYALLFNLLQTDSVGKTFENHLAYYGNAIDLVYNGRNSYIHSLEGLSRKLPGYGEP